MKFHIKKKENFEILRRDYYSKSQRIKYLL